MNKNKCALLMLIALCASGCSFSNFLSSPASSESSKLSETSTVNSTSLSSEVTSSSTEESSNLPESSSSVEESSSTEESSSLSESSSSVEESSTSTANVDQETVDRVKSELTFPTSVKNDFNLPSEIDDPNKIEKYFENENNKIEKQIRFDVIELRVGNKVYIKHIENAFSGGHEYAFF